MTNNPTAMVIIPADDLQEIKENLAKILESLAGQNGEDNLLGDYVTEKQAQQMLGKKRTTLWDLRNEGKLTYTKVGSKVYYLKSSILELLEKNEKKRFR